MSHEIARKTTWWLLPWAVAVVPIAANAYLFARATGDDSFAVEEGYYQKSVRWDAHMDELRRSEALGWSASVQADGQQVRVRLEDGAGTPVSNAVIEIEAFAVARSGSVHRDTLVSDGNGGYRWTRPSGPAGLWELRLRAQRGDERFVHTVKQDLP